VLRIQPPPRRERHRRAAWQPGNGVGDAGAQVRGVASRAQGKMPPRHPMPHTQSSRDRRKRTRPLFRSYVAKNNIIQRFFAGVAERSGNDEHRIKKRLSLVLPGTLMDDSRQSRCYAACPADARHSPCAVSVNGRGYASPIAEDVLRYAKARRRQRWQRRMPKRSAVVPPSPRQHKPYPDAEPAREAPQQAWRRCLPPAFFAFEQFRRVILRSAAIARERPAQPSRRSRFKPEESVRPRHGC